MRFGYLLLIAMNRGATAASKNEREKLKMSHLERFELIVYFSDFKRRGRNFKSSYKILLERRRLIPQYTLEFV